MMLIAVIFLIRAFTVFGVPVFISSTTMRVTAIVKPEVAIVISRK